MGDDELTGRKAYLKIVLPADDVYPQTENEEKLKNVIHQMKAAHAMQCSELEEARLNIDRLNAEVEKKRLEIEQIESEEKQRRHAELRRVRTELLDKLQAQKADSEQLNRTVEQRDDTIRELQAEVAKRDTLLEDRRSELTAANTRIKELEREVQQARDLVAEVRAERDETQRKIGEKSTEVTELEEKLQKKENDLRAKDEEAADLRKRVAEAQERVDEVDTANKDLETAMFKREHEANLRFEQLELQLSTVTTELEETKLRSLQFENDTEFTEKTMQDLLDDNKDKDELVFRTMQIVLDQQAREQAVQDDKRAHDHEFTRRVRELREVDDDLLEAVETNTRKGVAPWGKADPSKTLVEVTPQAYPIVEGQPINIVITTRDADGAPVKAATAQEFQVSIAGTRIGCPTAVKAEKKSTVAEQATFVLRHFAPPPGWRNVRVEFRGEELHTGLFVHKEADEAERSAALPDDNDLTDAEKEVVQATLEKVVAKHVPADIVLSASIVPSCAKPGERAELVLVARDGQSLRPLLGGDDLAEKISLAPFFHGQAKAVWLQAVEVHHRVGESAVYKAAVQLPDSSAVDFFGVAATLGDNTTTALCSLQPPVRKGRVEFDKTTVACYPDPCCPGEIVTCIITTRDEDLAPAAIEDGQDVLFTCKGINGVHEITPVTQVDDSTWRTTFVAERRGRSGIDVAYSGVPLARATVETRNSNKVVPAKTTVHLSPAETAKAGQRVYVTIKTRDIDGRLAAGPAPSAFKVTPTGAVVQTGSHKIHAVSRGSVDGEYHTHFTVEQGASVGTEAGVVVALEGQNKSQAVVVSSVEGEHVDPADAAENPPLVAAFTRDPVVVDEAAFVIVESNEKPTVIGVANVLAVQEPREVRWARGLWITRVLIGDRTGHASVMVTAENKTINVTVGVEATSLRQFDTEINRLRAIQMRYRQEWDGQWKAPAREKSSSKKGTSKKRLVMYPKIGIELIDNEPNPGAKVVMCKPHEPAELAGLVTDDVLVAIRRESDENYNPITQNADFRAFLKSLGNEAPFPLLIIKLEDGRELSLQPAVSEVLVAGKRSVKSKSSKRSTRRSKKSTKKKKSKKSTKKSKKSKKSTKKSKKSTKKSTKKSKKSKLSKKGTKLSKKSTKKSTKKKKGVMTSSQFKAARAKTGATAGLYSGL